MYNCIVVDDHIHAIEGIKTYLESFPELQLFASYTDSLTALAAINSLAEPIDLVLLDIDMPKVNGLELSRIIRKKTNKLVFTTGHTRYGYEAFQVDADAYLLKPYTLAEFAAIIDKLFLPEKENEIRIQKNEFFLVKSKEDNQKLINVKYRDIIAIESKLNYIMIYTRTKKILTYMSLTEIAKVLSKHPGFMQFQRSYIIAQDYIESIDGNSIRMINGLEITVGDYYRKDFTRFLNEKIIKLGRKG
ncbi:LytR/AlgR family response regulator transcription factor [Pedobacter sp. AW31-3R]|uniref:LytR/AlgR family response regulator transcription factor n=1 Tax=Pedobacter sp. AW31-3R TaxID=3445781 RepID=UPI003FA0FC64